MLDLLKNCCNWYLFSLIKNHLNEHKIYCNFWFLIEKLLETYQVYYAVLLITSEFIFILSRFSVSLKSLDNYFFRWFAYKSLLRRFSVLVNYMWSSNHFSISSRFPRPGFRSSPKKYWYWRKSLFHWCLASIIHECYLNSYY